MQVAPWCLLAVAAPLWGCGGSPRLEGSLSTLMDLKYERAEVIVAQDSLALRFLKGMDGGVGENLVLSVSARTEGLTLEAGMDIDLAELLSDERPRGALGRNITGDPRTTLPEVTRGHWSLSDVPEAGKRLRGEFSATFAMCTDAACGRTVFGSYEARVP
jgi:hypothetical protein